MPLAGTQYGLICSISYADGAVKNSNSSDFGVVVDDYVRENIAPEVYNRLNAVARALGIRVRFANFILVERQTSIHNLEWEVIRLLCRYQHIKR